MKLVVSQQDGYRMVGMPVVGVGWELGRVVGGHVELPAARSPPCHSDPQGLIRRSHKTGSPPVRFVWPAGLRAGRAQHQQFWKSVRPIRRSGQVAGRPNAAAAGLEVRPSESSSRPGRGPPERSSSRSGSPSVRVIGPGGPRGGRQQQQVWKSVRPRRRPGRGPAERSSSRSGGPSVRVVGSADPAENSSSRSGGLSADGPSRRAGQVAGRPSIAAAGLEVRPSESSGRPSRGSAADRRMHFNAAAAGLEARPSVRVKGPAGPWADSLRAQQQQQVWKSVRQSRRAGRPAGQQQVDVPTTVVDSEPSKAACLEVPSNKKGMAASSNKTEVDLLCHVMYSGGRL
jgi:hypothetical protein